MQGYRDLLKVVESYSELGSKTFRNGAKAIGNLPSVGKDAYMHTVFPVCSIAEVSDIEQKVGIVLPESYRSFLLSCGNGIDLFFRTLTLDGYKTSRRSNDCQPFDIVVPNTFERPDWIDYNNLIIGSYHWDGSPVMMTPNGNVSVHEIESGKVLCKWKDLSTFFRTEASRLPRFFSDDGIEFDEDANTVPPNQPIVRL